MRGTGTDQLVVGGNLCNGDGAKGLNHLRVIDQWLDILILLAHCLFLFQFAIIVFRKRTQEIQLQPKRST